MQIVSLSFWRDENAWLSRDRYKPDVRLRLVTEELGFESDEEACQFILEHVPDESPSLLEERDGDVRFLTGKVGPIFQNAKTRAFGQIDIKGQI